VRILDTGVEWLSDRVANGEADMALGPDRIASPDVMVETLYPSAWVAWCAPDHPMAAHRHLAWADALQWPLVAAGRDHEHSVLPRLPDNIAATVKSAQIVDNVTTALGLAAAGMGFTCSPAYLAGLARRMGLVQCELTNPTIMRAMTLYTPLGRRPSSWAAALATHIRETHLGPASGIDD
jgi:DNA-binding transcriptional LysR family regulator